MKGIARKRTGKVIVLSLAQFRPEKDQMKQLEAWALLPLQKRAGRPNWRCRRRHRHGRPAHTRRIEATSGLMDGVEFLVSAPRAEIWPCCQPPLVCTSLLEHFGIAVVEFMAASSSWPTRRAGRCWISWARQGERGFVTDARDYATKSASVMR